MNRRSVSIVDDDPSMLYAMTQLLRSMGWQVFAFHSAEAFLHSGCCGRSSLIISDLNMPNMSGVEMHERLKRLGRSLPTVFVTASSKDAGIACRPDDSGDVAVFTKPLNVHRLSHFIQTHIDQNAGRRMTVAKPSCRHVPGAAGISSSKDGL